jgi:hypothetical protein
MKHAAYRSGSKVVLMLFISATLLLLNSTTAFAQISGRGGDGYTRVMWTGNDSSIQVWKLDNHLNYVYGVGAGPYSGWIPVAFTVGDDNYSRVVWKSTDGQLALWLLDRNLNYVSSYAYGPYLGWLPETTGVDAGGYEQLIWRHTLGYMGIWILSPDQSRVLVSASYLNGGYLPGGSDEVGMGEAMSSSPMGQDGQVSHSLPKGITPYLRQLSSAPARVK